MYSACIFSYLIKHSLGSPPFFSRSPSLYALSLCHVCERYRVRKQRAVAHHTPRVWCTSIVHQRSMSVGGAMAIPVNDSDMSTDALAASWFLPPTQKIPQHAISNGSSGSIPGGNPHREKPARVIIIACLLLATWSHR